MLPIIPCPAPVTLPFSLTGQEYSLIVAALRMLEDDMRDAGDREALAHAEEAVALRAKLRATKDRGPVLAEIIPIRSGAPR